MAEFDHKIFSCDEIDSLIAEQDYSSAAKIFFEKQLKEWQGLKDNYTSFKKVKVNDFWFNGFKIKTQFNPGRIQSTSAKTDLDSIKSRRCFLCYRNLPAWQKGLLLKKKYFLLCNPYPVFPEHFTIASVDHKPQLLGNHVEDLLVLTKNLSKHYSVIYNGPNCGASAPDHLHFQVGTKNYLPIEDEFHQVKNEYGEIIYDTDQNLLSAVDDGLRTFVLIESNDKSIIVNLFEKFYKVYSENNFSEDESLLNIINFYDHEFGWTLFIFLREKHRSRHYYNEGEDQILVSPASIDLGGILVLPREKDFGKINKQLIEEIFKEVSLSREKFISLKEKLKIELGN